MADPAAPEIGHASVEHEGRVLTGGGTTTAELEAVMERHAPPEPEAAPESAPAPAATATADPSSPPKPTRGQARFAELTQKAKDAEAKAAAAEQKARDLEARLSQPAPASAATQQTVQHAQQIPATSPQAPPSYTRPRPTEDDIGGKYPTYADFVEDRATWVFEQRQAEIDARIRQGIEGDRAYRSYQDQVEATRAKGRAAYADFDAMLNSGPGGQVQMPLDRIQAIYALPNSEHVQYQVMKDAQLAQRLAQLPPIAFGLELAKLSPTGNGAAPVVAAVAQAPAPYQPVGSGSRTTVPTSAEIAEKGVMDFDKSGYREARAKERGMKFRKFGR